MIITIIVYFVNSLIIIDVTLLDTVLLSILQYLISIIMTRMDECDKLSVLLDWGA